jgi:L-fuculose-phosphate aldolase
MLMKSERIQVVEYGNKLASAGLVTGTSGNISIYKRSENLMAISPSGIDYQVMLPEDVVVMDLQQTVVDGSRKPSSEYRLHSIFYEKRADAGAVVHTHSPFATTVACLNLDLPAVHYMIAVAGHKVTCAKYATFGTDELAENAFQAMEDRKAVLLANHGLVAVGEDISAAFKVAAEIEYVAEIYLRSTAVGVPVVISAEEMGDIIIKFKSYGQKEVDKA